MNHLTFILSPGMNLRGFITERFSVTTVKMKVTGRLTTFFIAYFDIEIVKDDRTFQFCVFWRF